MGDTFEEKLESAINSLEMAYPGEGAEEWKALRALVLTDRTNSNAIWSNTCDQYLSQIKLLNTRVSDLEFEAKLDQTAKSVMQREIETQKIEINLLKRMYNARAEVIAVDRHYWNSEDENNHVPCGRNERCYTTTTDRDRVTCQECLACMAYTNFVLERRKATIT